MTMKLIYLTSTPYTGSTLTSILMGSHPAVDEMADEATFRGYGPEQGYPFLREKIAEHDFQARGADIAVDEIFISDGAKCDTANIQEIFAAQANDVL